MNSLNPQPTYITSAEIIVERLRVSIKTRGLEATIHDFEGMERLLSGLPFWPEVKAGAEIVFAEEDTLTPEEREGEPDEPPEGQG